MPEITDPNLNAKLEEKYGIAVGESTIHTSEEYNKGTIQTQLIHEEVNTAANWHTIVEAIKSGRARDIDDEPKTDQPCFILGSGPSLDDSIKYLKEWKGGIICTTSHALTLMYYGIEPTHILVLDPFCIQEEIAGIDWSKTRTKLIIHPSVHPSIVENWPNEMLLYIQNSGKPNSFYQNTQKRMYTHREGDLRNPTFHFYIRTEIAIFACSPPMQMFVADKLGYKALFLAGCDFGYHTDKDRFTDFTIVKPGYFAPVGNSNDVWVEPIWEEHRHDYKPHPGIKISNNGLPTEEIHLYYKKNFLSAWRLCLHQVYSTDHGAMPEVPYADIKKVIKKQGLEFPKQSKQFISKIVERYLASVNAFVVEAETGVVFVESNNYKQELMDFMMNLRRTYQCPSCKVMVKAEDKKDHFGERCPNCKNDNLGYATKIDIDYNMKKFERLYNATHEIKEVKKEFDANAPEVKEAVKQLISDKKE